MNEITNNFFININFCIYDLNEMNFQFNSEF